jgi:hypothetical protein
MSTIETSEMIAQNRTVTADALLEGRADLRSYPFKHLAVLSRRGVATERVSFAVAAVEVLSQYGWELVNVAEFADSGLVYAFVRLRDM